jgi:solute carrier family 25 phosphate transporter 3
MVKFATFETTVERIYAYGGRPKDSYTGAQQVGISFLGGYIAGVGCAIVSHPADVMVSKLNADRRPGEGAGSAIARIYSKIGFGGLWNGLATRILVSGSSDAAVLTLQHSVLTK